MPFRFAPFVLIALVLGPEARAEGARPSVLAGSPIRVQSQLSVSVPVSGGTGQPSDEIKAMESARNMLYEVSGRECTALQQTYGAECKLTGMSINSRIDNRGSEQTINLSVSNTYELRSKP